jgi:quinol monooxygenase YgiN
MYGRIVKLMLKPGNRDETIELFKSSAAAMPGCLSYVVARDSSDADVLWIIKVWTARSVTVPRSHCPLYGRSFPNRKH